MSCKISKGCGVYYRSVRRNDHSSNMPKLYVDYNGGYGMHTRYASDMGPTLTKITVPQFIYMSRNGGGPKTMDYARHINVVRRTQTYRSLLLSNEHTNIAQY